ncbi:MAG: hypothetical protein QNJ45_16360 [Ardenticatenaceae bacterium]|nr:hypothetical protein [Ardenticatenaceae bacterium]
MKSDKPSTTDQILDLLLEALLERQKNRSLAEDEVVLSSSIEEPEDPEGNMAEPGLPTPEPSLENLAAETPPDIETENDSWHPAPNTRHPTPDTQHLPAGLRRLLADEPDEPADPPAPIPETLIPEKLPSIHLERMLGRLAIVLIALIVTVNIPFNSYGTSLARALPDEKAMIIRDGLVLKGSGPDIYVLENNQRRWISSLDAFRHYGYTWAQVNEVEDDFLESFPEGLPIHLLYKCTTSPHVYAIENGEKRWIKDIETFSASGYVWEDIRFVGCSFLRDMPDGVPIPPEAGEPPQP